MNLTSCNACGVVLDKSKLKFPEDIVGLDGWLDMTKCDWDGDKYVPFTNCPVCNERIFDND